MAHVRSCGLSLLCALSCALLCALGFSDPVSAQDADRIWGQVHTKSGDVHEGFIRWDGNEVSWVDLLDGFKEVPGENYQALARIERRRRPACPHHRPARVPHYLG